MVARDESSPRYSTKPLLNEEMLDFATAQPGGFEGIVEGWEVTDLGGLPSAKGDDQPELAYLAA